jgi:hypothetical protein
MKINSKIAATFIVLMMALLMSCSNNVNTDIEQTLSPYLELDAIEEASNTTLTIQRGTAAGLDSYFAFDVSNVKTNGIISEGMVEGWCLEWDKPIAQNNDRHDGVEAYSTFGSDNWKPANYLMSIREKLKREDPSLTYKEIQIALWSLIDVPQFNVDEVLAAGRMPSRMMTNGQPNFSVSKVKDIVNQVRSNVNEYSYTETTPYLIFARTDDGSQNGGFVPCESGEASQCDGYISISGSVYVDADANEMKGPAETGVQSTTVILKDIDGSSEHVAQTDDDGNYSFLVFTNDIEKTFSIEVPAETPGIMDFNEELFDTHNATTAPASRSITTAASVDDQNFGFAPKIEDLIIALTPVDIDGDGVLDPPSIVTQTRSRLFWKKQIFLGIIQEKLERWFNIPIDLRAEISKDELLEYLDEVEGLLVDDPFQFGNRKLQNAFSILFTRNSDLNSLLSELLTAELNVVAGFGTDSPAFDRALLSFGEAAAVGLREDNLPGLRAAATTETLNLTGIPDVDSVQSIEDAQKIMREIEISEKATSNVTTTAMPLRSSLVLRFQDAEPLLRAFNFSGGGGGGTIGPR